MASRAKTEAHLAGIVASRVRVTFRPEAECPHPTPEFVAHSSNRKRSWFRCPDCLQRFSQPRQP